MPYLSQRAVEAYRLGKAPIQSEAAETAAWFAAKARSDLALAAADVDIAAMHMSEPQHPVYGPDAHMNAVVEYNAAREDYILLKHHAAWVEREAWTIRHGL